MKHAILVLSLAWLSSATLALASDELGDIVTDRPDFTESAVVTPTGHFQLESGLTWTEESGGVTIFNAPELLIRWTPFNRFELRFGISDYVKQQNHIDVSGLGDAVLMFKYSPKAISLYSKNSLSFGIGSRLPIGENDASRQGFTLAEDLQPSTGAFGAIGWVYGARALNDSTSLRTYGSLTYTYNGDNDRDYQFGHTTTASIGGSYQTESPWGFNLEVLFSHSERDRRASVDIPNTGGKWLDFIPAVQYHLNESLAVRASAKIPLSRDLNDQL